VTGGDAEVDAMPAIGWRFVDNSRVVTSAAGGNEVLLTADPERVVVAISMLALAARTRHIWFEAGSDNFVIDVTTPYFQQFTFNKHGTLVMRRISITNLAAGDSVYVYWMRERY
jgi:hypothetical protein